MAETARAGVLRKAHVKALLELAPGGCRLDAKIAQVFLAPAARGIFLDEAQQLVENDAGRVGVIQRAAALAGAQASGKRFVG